MFRFLRTGHKWVGLGLCLFFVLIGLTGTLLAFKSRVSFLRPEERVGDILAKGQEAISPTIALKLASRAAGFPGRLDEFDRIEYRPKKNIYKLVSKMSYVEVQICGTTGRILQMAKRNDQFIEDLHDLSFFSVLLRENLLPIVGIGLFSMSISGLLITLVPVARRRKFKKSQLESIRLQDMSK